MGKIISTVQYRFTIPFYAGAVGAHEITQPEEKLAKMKTLPKMSHHGSGGERPLSALRAGASERHRCGDAPTLDAGYKPIPL